MRLPRAAACLTLFFAVGALEASTVYNFDGFSDSAIFTTQYAGLTFSNAIVLTAGISLNEFEFPPHSGASVVADNSGPITIAFNPAIQTFAGYFTYTVALTMRAFDSSHNLLSSATSRFSNNEAISGVSGSSPNEVMQVSSAAGISSVTVTGSAGGSSFVMDDATVTALNTVPSTPAPPTLMLALIGLGFAAWTTFRARREGGGAQLARSLAAAVLLAPAAAWLWAAPQSAPSRPEPKIASFAADRSSIPAHTSTNITFFARIDDDTLIPGSLNLIRLDAAGGAAILGKLQPARTAHTYSVRVALNEPGPGPVRVAVSGAFRGRLKRTISDPLTLSVTGGQK